MTLTRWKRRLLPQHPLAVPVLPQHLQQLPQQRQQHQRPPLRLHRLQVRDLQQQ